MNERRALPTPPPPATAPTLQPAPPPPTTAAATPHKEGPGGTEALSSTAGLPVLPVQTASPSTPVLPLKTASPSTPVLPLETASPSTPQVGLDEPAVSWGGLRQDGAMLMSQLAALLAASFATGVLGSADPATVDARVQWPLVAGVGGMILTALGALLGCCCMRMCGTRRQHERALRGSAEERERLAPPMPSPWASSAYPPPPWAVAWPPPPGRGPLCMYPTPPPLAVPGWDSSSGHAPVGSASYLWEPSFGSTHSHRVPQCCLDHDDSEELGSQLQSTPPPCRMLALSRVRQPQASRWAWSRHGAWR